MARQPAIGSAVLTDDEQESSRARDRLEQLRALRRDLGAALGVALTDLNGGTPPIDVLLRLDRSLEGILDRWQS